MKTEISQEEQQLPELSETSKSSAASELQNRQGLLTTAFSSLQIIQTPPTLTLKMSQGSPVPPCQNFLESPVSYSSIHLNSHLPLTLSSGVLAPQVPSAKTSESLLAPYMSPPTGSKSLLAPRGSPATISSSSCRVMASYTQSMAKISTSLQDFFINLYGHIIFYLNNHYFYCV